MPCASHYYSYFLGAPICDILILLLLMAQLSEVTPTHGYCENLEATFFEANPFCSHEWEARSSSASSPASRDHPLLRLHAGPACGGCAVRLAGAGVHAAASALCRVPALAPRHARPPAGDAAERLLEHVAAGPSVALLAAAAAAAALQCSLVRAQAARLSRSSSTGSSTRPPSAACGSSCTSTCPRTCTTARFAPCCYAAASALRAACCLMRITCCASTDAF